jgi:hypothetical protein
MTGPSSVPSGGPDAEITDGDARSVEQRERVERQGPVVRDKRRLDPQTGQVRAAYAAAESSGVDTAQLAGRRRLRPRPSWKRRGPSRKSG